MAVTRERKLAKSPSAPSRCSPRSTGCPPRTSSSTRWSSRWAPATRTTWAPRWRPSRACALIKARFPDCKTILGISNVSFGLPAAGREVLNSVFLYHCTQGGPRLRDRELREASSATPPFPRRSAGSPRTCIFMRGARPGGRLRRRTSAARRRSRRVAGTRAAAGRAAGPLHRRGLPRRAGARISRRSASEAAPLDIINGPLDEGHGRGRPALQRQPAIVAEVLQSAEAMKAAVRHLEQFMEKAESATRGSIVLATVKGDVHDIGKNLVEIILATTATGSEPGHQGAARGPDRGVSGAQARCLRALRAPREVRAADGAHRRGPARGGHRLPLFVGGAALTRKFTATRIAPEYPGATIYAKDAMDGLDLANRLFGATTREALLAGIVEQQAALRAGDEAPASARRSRRAAARPIGGVSHRSGAAAAGPRPPRIARRAAHSRLSVPQPPDAPGQASGPQGLGGAPAGGGRPQDGGAARHGASAPG